MSKASVKQVEALPAGEKVLREGGGEAMPLDAESIRLLMHGWSIKQQLDALKAELDAVNARLIEAHGTGVSLLVRAVCRASPSAREAVHIEDAERLRQVLGFRFTDLVKTEVTYKPEHKLVEMACDADEPLQPAIAACLRVVKSLSVTWRAER